MPRTPFALLPILVVLAVATAAPRPKDKERPKPYHATVPGTTLVYDGGDRGWPWEVTAVEPAGGETRVTVSVVAADGKYPLDKVSVSARGVFLVESGPFKLGPACRPRFPVKEGDSWEYVVAPQQGLVGQSATMTVGKVEEVEVPAGKFQAVRVDMVITSQNGQPLDPPKKYASWYDPDVGLVRMAAGDGGFTRVLKSVTRPGRTD